MHSGTGGAKIASLYEGGAERSETEGVMRLRRMRNAETAFPTLLAEGISMFLRAVTIRPYPPAVDRQFTGKTPRGRHGCIRALRTPAATSSQRRRTVGRAYMRAVAATAAPQPLRHNPSAAVRRHLPLHRGGEARRETNNPTATHRRGCGSPVATSAAKAAEATTDPGGETRLSIARPLTCN